jgi:hypothetical protein
LKAQDGGGSTLAVPLPASPLYLAPLGGLPAIGAQPSSLISPGLQDVPKRGSIGPWSVENHPNLCGWVETVGVQLTAPAAKVNALLRRERGGPTGRSHVEVACPAPSTN